MNPVASRPTMLAANQTHTTRVTLGILWTLADFKPLILDNESIAPRNMVMSHVAAVSLWESSLGSLQ